MLLHGVGLRSGVWAPQIEALCSRHDVVAMDMPGHGGSSLPPPDACLADYSRAVLALLDGLGIVGAHVVGHSMGALVALDFALDHPDRVLGLVAMNAVFCRTPEQTRAVMARVGSTDEAASPRDWSGTIERWFGHPVPGALRDAAARVRDLLHGIDPVGYARTYRLFATSDAAHSQKPRRVFAVMARDGQLMRQSRPGLVVTSVPKCQSEKRGFSMHCIFMRRYRSLIAE